MPITCPCCRASNDAGPACRRCKADLALLFAVEERRAFLIAEARRRASVGLVPEAVRTLTDAERLRSSADVRRLRAAALLSAGEFAAAWAAYHALVSTPPTPAG